MNCSKCGADNPDNAEFCSLCMQKLFPSGDPAAQRRPSAAPGDLYVAPGEWRGEVETLRPKVSGVVKAKVRKFRFHLLIYGIVIAIVVVWLGLSFTLWGNPSAGKRAMQLIEAANARDKDAFVGCFQLQSLAAAEDMYTRVISYLGSSGRYEDIKLDVDQPNNYVAYSSLESGSIQAGTGSVVNISGAENLKITLENHEGKWWVVITGTDIIP